MGVTLCGATSVSGVLPASIRLAWWGTSWLRGHVVADELIDAVVGDDATHLFGGPDAPPDPLVSGLGALRARGADAVGAAFPAEGDLVGLGGPADFNRAALEVGEAVVVLDAASFVVSGLVPDRVGAAVTWRPMPAERRQVPDLGEADRELRTVLLESSESLARLEVARWRPEVADRLMNLRHRPRVVTPPGVPERCADLAARGWQAVEIAELALEDDGGALTAHESDLRRSAIAPLGRAGRRALVAAASPEVWPPS
jgi:hypothetical protein